MTVPKTKYKQRKVTKASMTVYLSSEEVEMVKAIQNKLSEKIEVSLSDVLRLGMKELYVREVVDVS